MRDSPAFGKNDLGGSDVHSPVLLHGVGADDLAPDPFGDVKRKSGLAGAGGTDDRNGPGH